MEFHSARYTPIDNKPSARRTAGSMLAMLLFWIFMLGLLGSPIWLPVLVEMLVP